MVSLLFIRQPALIVNYFVYCEFNGQQICFCNWNILVGPPPGSYAFTGLNTTWFNQLIVAGVMFCPNQATKVNRIILNNPLDNWIVV